MDNSVKRGDIFYADLSPVVGSEQGGELYSGGALVRNHLYLATMSDHYLVAGNSTVKVLARGGYRVS